MPSVKIEVGHIVVALEANESSVSDLSKQAVDLARELNGISPARMGMGFRTDSDKSSYINIQTN